MCTYICISRASNKSGRGRQRRLDGSTGRKTARNLYVHSRQQHSSSHAVPESAVEVGKDTNSKCTKGVGNGCRGRELHVGEEVDGISCCRDDDHDGHLLVFRLHCKRDEENVEWNEQEIPVLVQWIGTGLCVRGVRVDSAVDGCADSNAVSKKQRVDDSKDEAN